MRKLQVTKNQFHNRMPLKESKQTKCKDKTKKSYVVSAKIFALERRNNLQKAVVEFQRLKIFIKRKFS